MTNYDSVLDQLRAAGLEVRALEFGRLVRCRVQGDREKRGWYALHEVTGEDGERLIVGSFGIWRGTDNGAQKIQVEKGRLSPEKRKALAARIEADRRKADAARRRRAERAAARAEKVWSKLSPTGESDYLARKGVQAHGVRFTDKGALAVPLMDLGGRVHGLQFILSRETHKERIRKTGRDKEYWPSGMAKAGKFFMIGLPGAVGIIAEGYATAASLHEATGLCTVVAFDANNLLPVAQLMAKRYPATRWIIAADDDDLYACTACGEPVRPSQGPDCPHCGEPHRRRNAGVEAAEAAALAIDGAVLVPRFADDAARFERYRKHQGKLTDFNDLHLAEGLATVRAQVEALLEQRGWRTAPEAGAGQNGGGGEEVLRPIDSLDELLTRFSLVYGHGGTVFDHQEHMLLALSDMRDACVRRELHRAWQEHPDRSIVRIENVGFDPTEKAPGITCNLWRGWPTQPKKGKCDLLLELAEYMCSKEPAMQRELFDWLIRWLAYPLQNPGAKMRSTIVVHGPQGTGKNLLFEAVMAIYGPYGGVIDQNAIEDKHNDWASRKLFLIADEVVARTDLFHIKNKLKGLITGTTIRINPKHLRAYDERNHCNLIFLSNEVMPTVLEEDDRRHCVIWTPDKVPEGFYQEVAREIEDGGVAAFYDYLLNVDLAGFNEHTKPPMTEAKADLIELGMDSISRFCHALVDDEIIEGFTKTPVLSSLLYELYGDWCKRAGYGRAATDVRFFSVIKKRHGVRTGKAFRKRYLTASGKRVGPVTFAFFPGCEEKSPDSDSESVWLGRCVSAHRAQIDDWKESTE